MTEEEKNIIEESLNEEKEKGNSTEDTKTDNENFEKTHDYVQQVKPTHSRKGKGLGCGVLAIFLFIVILVLLIIARSLNSEREVETVDWSEASIMSELFIKGFMKFPDDVYFIKESRKVNKESNKVFKITGRLKANNAFGQAIPYTYNIRIKYNGGDWSSRNNWSFMGGNLYNEAAREFTELE